MKKTSAKVAIDEMEKKVKRRLEQLRAGSSPQRVTKLNLLSTILLKTPQWLKLIKSKEIPVSSPCTILKNFFKHDF